MREDISEMIMVEVAYALPQRQAIISITVENGTTALEAIQRSGLLLEFPDIALKDCKIGIFGKIVSHNTILKPMDRVEIYRPLIADAKEARRLRAAANTGSNAKNAAAQKNSVSFKK
ncbi:MAG TPA: RnfH family protein [Methylophilus sp.]|nr:RnfH family protein [Methylophilus sp.]